VQSRAALLVFLIPAVLPAQNPFAGNATEADIGRAAFRSMCAPCHGIKAQGGRGPDLTLGVYNAGNKDEDLFRVISNGVSGTEMPGFGVRIGDDNVWRMVTYVRSVATHQEVPAKGNKAAGEAIFWGKGNCGACHRVGARGGPMGPDLSRAGRKRSLAYLRESLLDPNADLTPGFYKITVVTKDGRKITGTQRGFDNFSAQLMTMDGSLHSFQRDEVTACDREHVSLMPSYKNLTESEMNDLLAYLVTLRGEMQ
jgi:putative heme-binding domain-containing protein